MSCDYCLTLFLVNSIISSLQLVTYRSGSKPPTDDFFNEFGDVPERTSSYKWCIIVGDVKLHLDDLTAPNADPFLLLLDNFGLSERVR